MQAINDTVGQWKMLIMKPVQEINSNPFILNLQNGLYHTLDNSFKAHTPEYFSTVQLKAAYAPGCKLPAVFALSGKYAGRGGNPSHSGDHGLPAPAGEQGAEILCLCGCAQRRQKAPCSMWCRKFCWAARMCPTSRGRTLATASTGPSCSASWQISLPTCPPKSIDDNGMFKALTGEDFITAERKNKDPFSFRPYARFPVFLQ